MDADSITGLRLCDNSDHLRCSALCECRFGGHRPPLQFKPATVNHCVHAAGARRDSLAATHVSAINTTKVAAISQRHSF